MGKRVIYITCHDDVSEQKARETFGKYDWARVYRIPEESQSHLMESVMYTTELMKVYDEWKDAEFVGTLSYSAADKFDWYLKNQEKTYNISTFVKTVKQIETTSSLNYDVVGFVVNMGSRMYTDPIMKDIFCKSAYETGILERTPIYSVKSRKIELGYMLEGIFFIHNYWMTSPACMLSYIKFFNQMWLPTIEKQQNIWYNSNYNNGRVSKEKLLKLSRGRADYWPYHPMISELLPIVYFKSQNVRILKN
jgi:hypothetical protein